MKNIWDDKYSVEEYVYGTSPNDYFKYAIGHFLPSGKLFLPGEGEGRNAVYAAQKGLDVVAYDQSTEGKNKAIKLAQTAGVAIDYRVGNLLNLPFEKESFDAAALIFAHFSHDIRSEYHTFIADLVKRGGLIIVEGFSVQHTDYQQKNPSIGGPRNVEMLYTIEMMQNDFINFTPIELLETETELSEGIGHNGVGKVVRFIGRKNG